METIDGKTEVVASDVVAGAEEEEEASMVVVPVRRETVIAVVGIRTKRKEAIAEVLFSWQVQLSLPVLTSTHISAKVDKK
jgi:stress response protein YsnF